MKKIIVMLITLLLIAGCSSKDNGDTGTDKSDKADGIKTSEKDDTANDEASDGEYTEDSIKEDKDDVTTFAEYDALDDKIDNDIADYQIDVVEDNPGKRVLLLKDENGELKYKSIFIKETNRLKITEIGGKMFFNRVIS